MTNATKKTDGRANNGGHSPTGAGRKPVSDDKKRKKITSPVAPETVETLAKLSVFLNEKTGKIIDDAVAAYAELISAR